MKYCPKCRGEYQDWVEKCLDCAVELTDTKPEPKIEPERKVITVRNTDYTTEPLVSIAEYENEIDAHYSQDILKDEGIESFIYDGNTAKQDWIGLHPRVKIQLIVKEPDTEKALATLDSIDTNLPITVVPDTDIRETDLPEEDSPEAESD